MFLYAATMIASLLSTIGLVLGSMPYALAGNSFPVIAAGVGCIISLFIGFLASCKLADMEDQQLGGHHG